MKSVNVKTSTVYFCQAEETWSLLQRTVETKEVRDFKPISVLNAYIKILSKILTNYLRGVRGVIIDDHQSGFLKGRSVLESIASAQEVIQFSKRIKIPGFMLKLDFEKAYDTVVQWAIPKESVHDQNREVDVIKSQKKPIANTMNYVKNPKRKKTTEREREVSLYQ